VVVIVRIHCVKHGQVIIAQYTHSVVKATVYLSFADHTLLVAMANSSFLKPLLGEQSVFIV